MNTIFLVGLTVFNVIFVVLNFALLLFILNYFHKVMEQLSILRYTYEKVFKMESILQHMQMSVMTEPYMSESTARAIRTPGGIVMATSLEDFLRKINNDPMFKGISKEQLEELRRLFEEHNDPDGDFDDDEKSQ